jgi:hypothetical protein
MNGLYETDDLDAAAFIYATTYREPSIYRDASTGRAVFSFHRDVVILELIEAYSTGNAVCNIRRFAGSRRRLFHEVRRIVREGGRLGA